MNQVVLTKIVKTRLSFRKVAQYYQKPFKTIDFNTYIKEFQDEVQLLKDDETNSNNEISNVLIDSSDEPQPILTLFDFNKKLQNNPNYKFINDFTECYKNAIDETVMQDKPVMVPLEETKLNDNLEKIPQVFEDLKKITDKFVYFDVDHGDEFSETSEVESTHWKLLECNLNTELDNNVFAEYNPEKKHWLDCPPVEWEVMEQAVSKCKEWLKKS